jgi:hypothetical protein
MAGLTEFYCGWNEPSHASQFKWLEYTFKLISSQYSMYRVNCMILMPVNIAEGIFYKILTLFCCRLLWLQPPFQLSQQLSLTFLIVFLLYVIAHAS